MSPVSRIEHTRCERAGDPAHVCDALPASPPPRRAKLAASSRRAPAPRPPSPGWSTARQAAASRTLACWAPAPRALTSRVQDGPTRCASSKPPVTAVRPGLRGALHQAPSSLRGLRVAQNAVFIPLVMGRACGARLPKRQVCRLRERPRLGGAREGSEATPAWRRKGRWLSLAAGGTAEPWAPPGPPRTPSLPGPPPSPSLRVVTPARLRSSALNARSEACRAAPGARGERRTEISTNR